MANSQRALPGPPQLHEGRRPQRPEQDERRVRRHEHRARDHQRRRDPHQRRERGGLGRAKQAPGDPGDERRQRAGQRERQRTDPKLGIAEQGSRRANEKRDHRRMIEIAERQGARPQGVIGFIEREFEPRRGERLHREQDERAARRARRRAAGCGARPTGAPRRRWKPPSRRRLLLRPSSLQPGPSRTAAGRGSIAASRRSAGPLIASQVWRPSHSACAATVV